MKIAWPTVVVVALVIGGYVALEMTGHPIPSWLAAAGTLIGGLLSQMLSGKGSGMAGAILIAFGAATATSACSGSPAVPPTAVNTGIDVGTCILDVVSKDLLAGKGLPEALQDASIRCLGAATTANVSTASDFWAAHKAAENREIDAGVR